MGRLRSLIHLDGRTQPEEPSRVPAWRLDPKSPRVIVCLSLLPQGRWLLVYSAPLQEPIEPAMDIRPGIGGEWEDQGRWIDSFNTSPEFSQVKGDGRDQVSLVKNHHVGAAVDAGVFKRLVITFRNTGHQNVGVRTELGRGRKDQVPDVFYEKQIQLAQR